MFGHLGAPPRGGEEKRESTLLIYDLRNETYPNAGSGALIILRAIHPCLVLGVFVFFARLITLLQEKIWRCEREWVENLELVYVETEVAASDSVELVDGAADGNTAGVGVAHGQQTCVVVFHWKSVLITTDNYLVLRFTHEPLSNMSNWWVTPTSNEINATAKIIVVLVHGGLIWCWRELPFRSEADRNVYRKALKRRKDGGGAMGRGGSAGPALLPRIRFCWAALRHAHFVWPLGRWWRLLLQHWSLEWRPTDLINEYERMGCSIRVRNNTSLEIRQNVLELLSQIATEGLSKNECRGPIAAWCHHHVSSDSWTKNTSSKNEWPEKATFQNGNCVVSVWRMIDDSSHQTASGASPPPISHW